MVENEDIGLGLTRNPSQDGSELVLGKMSPSPTPDGWSLEQEVNEVIDLTLRIRIGGVKENG